MRKTNLLPVVACLASLLVSIPVSAQDSGTPKLDKLEEAEPPTITIRHPSKEGAKIIEQRSNGAVNKVKVQTNGSTYYLKPKGAKATPPSEAQEGETSVPQWVVKEFDAGKNADSAQDVESKPTQ